VKKAMLEAVQIMFVGVLCGLCLFAWNPAPAADGIEYIFISADGSKHYEIVINNADVWAFKSMHNANISMPLSHYEKLQGK